MKFNQIVCNMILCGNDTWLLSQILNVSYDKGMKSPTTLTVMGFMFNMAHLLNLYKGFLYPVDWLLVMI